MGIYHGKVLRFEDAKKILALDVDLDLGPLDKTVIPFEHARSVILKNPDKLLALDCACRSTRENGCYPRDVCIWIGEPFFSFILDHNTTGNPRIITSEEAIAIMEAERERGHMQHALFKDAMGDRLYCICNCCSCCCNAIKAHNYTTVPTFIPSGYVRDVNNDKCQGCGTCVETCNFFAVSLVDEKAVVDQAKCLGCGLCEEKCPNGAITLKRDPAKTEPLDIDELRQKYGR
ncbi:MAG: 4Fe-4S binding protein [Firmicutes bacterium]|nr:4Fe-4S binding protein [Bacillota bacterium]